MSAFLRDQLPELLEQTSIDVDGLEDEKHDIRYLGRATRDEHGEWSCLAIVQGSLCRVAITVVPLPAPSKDT